MRSQFDGNDPSQVPQVPYDPEQLDISAATTPAAAVARWWGNVIVNPNFDNGADDMGNIMAQGIATMGHEQIRDDIERHVGAFVHILEGAIDDALQDNPYFGRNLSTDYHPDRILADAAAASGMSERGIDMFVFPWKSSTYIEADGTVAARMGYGKAAKQIWPPEGKTPEDMAKLVEATTVQPAEAMVADADTTSAQPAPAPKQGPARRFFANIARAFSGR